MLYDRSTSTTSRGRMMVSSASSHPLHAARSAGARPGGSFGPGMYPPMAPGNREEDGEHRNRYDNGLDLLDDLPPAFPPVLGE